MSSAHLNLERPLNY